eukprot:CAMPEP_0202381372 /NCGR_PEP_ID=MMETSP1127-20130417/35219_1 /ASSEMBLY_ACC=CAM_ASM_000462 /TAXON_ID=3047 /ORGANISM="Dunaliella tertiolecta, Strain CCMP1320" /LENGTH=139 /DNA_ID=CAMNT_0048980315 /DNA_START=724 /DNA_END=1141 /DNA_ORIENTATION=-
MPSTSTSLLSTDLCSLPCWWSLSYCAPSSESWDLWELLILSPLNPDGMQAEGSVFEGSTALAACLKCAPAMLFGAVGAAAVAAAAAAAAAVAADNDAGGVSGPQSNNAHFRSHVLDPGKQEQAAELLWGGAAAAAAAAA